VRHALGVVLVIAAAAVATEARSFTAIGEWAADAPQRVLALLGARRDRYRAPDEATMRRVLQIVDPDAVDAAIGTWLTGHAPICAGPGPVRDASQDRGGGGWQDFAWHLPA
jgi:hypothetical protein